MGSAHLDGRQRRKREVLDRIDHLRKTGAHVKFLSLEPLLGPLPKMNLGGIDWAIVGGESGPGARPMDPEWVLTSATNAFGRTSLSSSSNGAACKRKRLGRDLEGRTWDQMPGLAVIS